MFTKCPCCGNETLKKIIPSDGDCYFIGSCNEKTKAIFADKGIIADIYLCHTCGSLQLRAKTN